MLLVDDLAAGGTKNLRHTPRGLVTLIHVSNLHTKSGCIWGKKDFDPHPHSTPKSHPWGMTQAAK